MSHTKIHPLYGTRPPCYRSSRIQERKQKAKTLKLLEQNRKSEKPDDFVIYEDSASEEEPEIVLNQALSTSYNFVDYFKNRETHTSRHTYVAKEYGSRHILTHEMFKESPIDLGPNMNKVFCSQWLSDRQIVFGTKCNKLMVYDVHTHKLDQIPSLISKREAPSNNDLPCGIHSVQLNPSKTLLATEARNTCDIAIYRLPTLDPICVGESAHKEGVFDICWLDDEFLVSGSRDTKLALWRITDDILIAKDEVPTYKNILPRSLKECRNAQKIRAITFNNVYQELATLSLNGYIHVWNVETFRQKMSRKLANSQENVCMTVHQNRNMYAIGCRTYTLLLDCRTLQPIKKVANRHSCTGIRSITFQGDILTFGTGYGMLTFYDLKASKYLESSINSSRTVFLKGSRGYVFPDEEYVENPQNSKYLPAIYTHCYDSTGTRLFAAGGPLSANVMGNYAGLWQ